MISIIKCFTQMLHLFCRKVKNMQKKFHLNELKEENKGKEASKSSCEFLSPSKGKPVRSAPFSLTGSGNKLPTIKAAERSLYKDSNVLEVHQVSTPSPRKHGYKNSENSSEEVAVKSVSPLGSNQRSSILIFAEDSKKSVRNGSPARKRRSVQSRSPAKSFDNSEYNRTALVQRESSPTDHQHSV